MKLTVRAKILSAFLVVFSLFLGVLAYGLVVMNQVSSQLTDLQNRYVRLTRVVGRMEIQQTMLERYDLERFSRERLRTPSVSVGLITFHSQEISNGIQECQSLLDSVAPSGLGDEPRPLVALQRSLTTLADVFFAYDSAMKRLMSSPETANAEEVSALATQTRARLLEIGQSIRAFSETVDESSGQAIQLARVNLERAQLAGAGLTLVTAVLGLSMMVLSNWVLRPISRLTEGVKRIGRGDYGSRMHLSSHDEIGVLAEAFNSMAESLQERELRLGRQRQELEHAYDALQKTNGDLRALSLYNANILKSISVGLLACDRDGRIVTANPRARAIFSHQGDGLVGMGLGEIRGLELDPLVQGVLESGGTVRRDSLTLRTPAEDGEEDIALLDCTLVPLKGDDDGEVEGAILLVEDVTERTAIRQRLLLSERLALIGKMSAQVTHEIRNPLNALGLNAELLEDELLDLDPEKVAEARALLSSISEEIDRLTEITEQYLSLARLPRPRLEREDVGVIVRSLVSFVAEDVARREISLDVAIEPGLPLVLLDDSQLRQALLNILRNSLDASHAGGTVTISVARRGNGVELAVADQGDGMDEAQVKRIFDPFFSTKQRGTGLGLPITQQIIEEHRGRISCESAPSEGSVFRIWLPGGVESPPTSAPLALPGG